VQPSTEFGMMVESAFTVESTPVATNLDSAPQSQSVLSSYDTIRAAQTALRDKNYYNGPINGVMNQATRDAIRNFQRDRNIANTGELDLSTARTLGIPVDVGGTSVGGAGGIGDPRQIAFLADRLLQDFQRELNIRNNRGQVIFDKQRNFKPHEVEVLSQMMSLRGSTELYSQLTASFTDRDTVKGAAVGLIRQSRLLDRIIRRAQMPLSSLVSSDLQQLQSELAKISIIDPNDSDIVR